MNSLLSLGFVSIVTSMVCGEMVMSKLSFKNTMMLIRVMLNA